LRVHAILLAAGLSNRFEDDQSKILFSYQGKPLLNYPLKTFVESSLFDTITLVANHKDMKLLYEYIQNSEKFFFIKVIEGGKTRHHSEEKALKYLKGQGIDGEDLISIHDVARPFIDQNKLKELIDCAKKHTSSVPAIKSRLIIVSSTTSLVSHQESYYRMQTPQTFLARELFYSYEKANIEKWNGVDTVECISKYTDTKAKIVKSSDLNMKVTYIEDLETIKRIIEKNDAKV